MSRSMPRLVRLPHRSGQGSGPRPDRPVHPGRGRAVFGRSAPTVPASRPGQNLTTVPGRLGRASVAGIDVPSPGRVRRAIAARVIRAEHDPKASRTEHSCSPPDTEACAGASKPSRPSCSTVRLATPTDASVRTLLGGRPARSTLGLGLSHRPRGSSSLDECRDRPRRSPRDMWAETSPPGRRADDRRLLTTTT